MHIPYENGGGTGEKVKWDPYAWVNEKGFDDFRRENPSIESERESFGAACGRRAGEIIDEMIIGSTTQERPEDPIDEVIQITGEAWEKNDLWISGDKLDNDNDNDLK